MASAMWWTGSMTSKGFRPTPWFGTMVVCKGPKVVFPMFWSMFTSKSSRLDILSPSRSFVSSIALIDDEEEPTEPSVSLSTFFKDDRLV